MKRILALFLLLPAVALGQMPPKYLASISEAGAGFTRGLVFHAPLDDVSNPLKIAKGTGAFTFSRTSSATYVHPATGLVTTAADNVLRIESAGALIEGARTNIALQSAVFKTTWARSNVTIVDDNTVGPDGNSTADQLQATNANATLLQTVTGTAVPYTFSVYLKRKNGTGNVDVRANSTTWSTCTINASTWTRCTVTATLTAASYTPGIRIVASGDNVYAWGAQMEAGAFASSYIPTVAAPVARSTDALTFPVAGNAADAAGSATVEFYTYTSRDNLITTRILGAESDGGAATPLCVYTEDVPAITFDGTGALSAGAGYTGVRTIRFASTWKAGTGRTFCANGEAPGSGVFDNTIVAGTNFRVGADTNGANIYFGNVKNLRLWNRVLTDAELRAITR